MNVAWNGFRRLAAIAAAAYFKLAKFALFFFKKIALRSAEAFQRSKG